VLDMISAIITTGWWLLVGHAVADFSLQTDVMAKGKNRHVKVVPPPGSKYFPCWPYWLSAHALINGGAVALATQSVGLGLAETVSHWAIDFMKCGNSIGVNTDQALHGVCKLIWLGAWVAMLPRG